MSMKKLNLLLIVLLISCSSGAYQNPYQAPYDGKKFSNLEPFPEKSLTSLLQWKFTSDRQAWPEWVDIVVGDKPSEHTLKGQINYTVINHATVLLQVDGVNILTDPIWSDRASPVSFIGPKRVHQPGLDFTDLPPIDVVMISHNHYDHLDIPTLKKLDAAHQPLILVGLKNGALLQKHGLTHFKEMDWYETLDVKGLSVTFMPNQHWSARGVFDKFETLWGGFIVSAQQGSIYFAGDTGYGKFFDTIKARFPNIVLSFLPIGAYEPRWFMQSSHINPTEAVKAHKALASQHSVAIHFGTFQLTDEARDAPKKALDSALEGQGISFLVPEFGQTYALE